MATIPKGFVAIVVSEANRAINIEPAIELADRARRLGHEPCFFTEEYDPPSKLSPAGSTFPRLENVSDHVIDLKTRFPANQRLPQALVEALKKFMTRHGPVRGVVAFRDSAIPAAAIAAQQLGLPAVPEGLRIAATDKWQGRRLESDAGLTVPRWSWVKSGRFAEVGFPLIMKPMGGTSSQGVQAIDSLTELRRVLEKMWFDGIDATIYGQLFEEKLSGREISAEGLWHKNEFIPRVATERIAENPTDPIAPGIGVFPPFDPDPTPLIFDTFGKVLCAYATLDQTDSSTPLRGCLVNGDFLYRVSTDDTFRLDVNVDRSNGWGGAQFAHYCAGYDLYAQQVNFAVGGGVLPRTGSPIADDDAWRIARIPLRTDIPKGQDVQSIAGKREMAAYIEALGGTTLNIATPVPYRDAWRYQQFDKRVGVVYARLPRTEFNTPDSIRRLQAELNARLNPTFTPPPTSRFTGTVQSNFPPLLPHHDRLGKRFRQASPVREQNGSLNRPGFGS